MIQPITININIDASERLINCLAGFAGIFKPSSQSLSSDAAVAGEAKPELPEDIKGVSDGAVSGIHYYENVRPIKGETYTEVDVRAAIDRTRTKIEGSDYKNNANSENYKKWHRTLTQWFKDTAKMFGAERPSELPDHESRRRFIGACERCMIEDGQICEATPF